MSKGFKVGKPVRSSRAAQRDGNIRIDDVARRVGYSTATVSRVLNNSPLVKEPTRRKILRAIEDLGYVPDAAARMMASNESRTIGAIVPTIQNSNYAIGITALQQRLRRAGYTLLISFSDYDAELELEEAKILASRGVDGMMLVGGVHHPDLFKVLESSKIAYVTTWVIDQHLPCIGFDNRESGSRIASYLLSIGHKNIAVIASLSETNDRASQRVAGIRDALTARGLALPDEHIIRGLGSIAEGKAAIRTLVSMPDMPTAVIGLNDALAFGALLEAQRQGIKVPGDLSVVGFDDLDFAAELTPALTTVRIPAAEIGVATAEYLLARIENRAVSRVVQIPANLIVRDSTASPRTPR
jgi:LacI family transcriptional regulator